MKLRTRLILGFTALLAVVLVANYVLVASLSRRAMVDYTLERVQSLTALLVKAGQYGLGVERNAEELLGAQMIVQATVAAHLVDVAENLAHLTPEEIKARLKDIADHTVLDEFWITDEEGHAYLRNREEIDFTFPSSPTERNQAWQFWHLIDADRRQFTQKAMEREYDGKVFKYAGVSGIDRPRIVQVGFNADSLKEFAAGMTAADLADAVIGEGGVLRLIVLGPEGQLYIDTEQPDRPEPDQRLRDPELRMLAEQAWETNAPAIRLEGDHLIVASPGQDQDGARYAFLTAFDAAPAAAKIRQAVIFTALVTGGMLVFGIGLAIHASRGIAGPIQTLAVEAAEIGQGNLDRSVEVKAGGEVGVLADAFNKMVASLKTHIQELRRTTAANERVESEMRIAAQVQGSMMPKRLPDVSGLRLFASTVPAREVGGDFYDFVKRPDGQLAAAIGDASGKGLPAALYATQCLSVLRTLTLAGDSLGDVLLNANSVLLASGEPGGLFATVFYGVYDHGRRTLAFVNAGHTVPILVRPGQAPAPLDSEPSLPVGMVPEFEPIEQQAALQPGDLLILYSDGVTEARNSKGELFGREGLLECVEQHRDLAPDLIIERISACVQQFTEGADPTDDLTVVILQITS